MTAKEYLTGLSRGCKEINFKLNRAIYPNTAQREGAAMTKEDHQNEIAEYREQLQDNMKKIFAVIDILNDPVPKNLLTLRYAYGLDWNKIAETMHYSVRHLARVHDRALKTIENNVNGERLWII